MFYIALLGKKYVGQTHITVYLNKFFVKWSLTINGNILCCLSISQLFAYFAYFYPNFCFKKIFLTWFRGLMRIKLKKCSFQLSFKKSIPMSNYGIVSRWNQYFKHFSWALHGVMAPFFHPTEKRVSALQFNSQLSPHYSIREPPCCHAGQPSISIAQARLAIIYTGAQLSARLLL